MKNFLTLLILFFFLGLKSQNLIDRETKTFETFEIQGVALSKSRFESEVNRNLIAKKGMRFIHLKFKMINTTKDVFEINFSDSYLLTENDERIIPTAFLSAFKSGFIDDIFKLKFKPNKRRWIHVYFDRVTVPKELNFKGFYFDGNFVEFIYKN